MRDFTLATPADDHELAVVLDIVSRSLHFPRDLADRFAAIVGREKFRMLCRSGAGLTSSIVGGLALHEMGQYFGGRSVRMAGVGAVGIAPEHRSGGAATAMMNLAVREMHTRGVPISTLYPATVPVYRRAGFELAGSRYEITIPIRQMRAIDRQNNNRNNNNGDGNALRIERIIEDTDRARIESLYVSQARQTPGLLERGEFSWKRVREPRGEKATGYKIVNVQDEIEGYAYLLQKDAQPGRGTLFDLHVTDALFSTPAAGRQILAMLHQHRSVCDTAIMFGSPDHPLLALMPERNFIAKHQFHWMLRMVDVGAALTARGWNPLVRAEVHLDVQDDLLIANNGRYVLNVRDGAAEVESGGRGDAIIDIRGLAALYTGHLSPHDLTLMGYLRAADHVRDEQAMLDALAALFAGPRPWLGDMF